MPSATSEGLVGATGIGVRGIGSVGKPADEFVSPVPCGFVDGCPWPEG